MACRGRSGKSVIMASRPMELPGSSSVCTRLLATPEMREIRSGRPRTATLVDECQTRTEKQAILYRGWCVCWEEHRDTFPINRIGNQRELGRIHTIHKLRGNTPIGDELGARSQPVNQFVIIGSPRNLPPLLSSPETRMPRMTPIRRFSSDCFWPPPPRPPTRRPPIARDWTSLNRRSARCWSATATSVTRPRRPRTRCSRVGSRSTRGRGNRKGGRNRPRGGTGTAQEEPAGGGAETRRAQDATEGQAARVDRGRLREVDPTGRPRSTGRQGRRHPGH
ncbi:MAG: hypothetical protein CM1200mP2_27490 [Planctomycetaceae bacterium]|nr:MAG: hypothetical protein CM1200mP2_27490 [Planctomycetaceae bacterium]